MKIKKQIKKNKHPFSIPNTNKNAERLGAVKPVFSFDYISLNKTDYCFNSYRIKDKKDGGDVKSMM